MSQKQTDKKTASKEVSKASTKDNKKNKSSATDLLFGQYMRTLIFQGSFKATLFFTKFLMVVNIVLIVIIFILAFKPSPKPLVFSLDENGRFSEIYPLNKDSLTQTQLLNWAEECVLELNSYTFYSAINHLNKVVPRCLTTSAGRQFLRNFETTILDDMRTSEQSFEASLNGTGIITASGVVEGRKAYQLQVPIIVTRYERDRTPNNYRYTIKMEIIRVSQEEFTKGVKIYRYSEVDG